MNQYYSSEYHAKYYQDHEAKKKAYQKEYRLKNLARIKIKDKYKAIKRNYGLNPEQYDALFQSQLGKCAICGKHQTELTKALCVDHCHTTGKIRGLLCNFCNYGIGFLDRKDFMDKALAYLQR